MVWPALKGLLGKVPIFRSVMADVIFETEPLKGQGSHSLLQWRVKRSVDGKSCFIGLKIRPDYYAGPEGSPMNYLNFSIEAAQQARVDLEKCIAECRRRAG